MILSQRPEQTYYHETDADEIRAFIGILYYSGLWKQSNTNAVDLWSSESGISFYRCIMPLKRFQFLLNNLRFDCRETRNKEDRFAPIREIFEIFMENCQRYYRPHQYCTVDEQMLDFRGRCIFRTYMKNKPDKYGLLLITLNDAKTSYLVRLTHGN